MYCIVLERYLQAIIAILFNIFSFISRITITTECSSLTLTKPLLIVLEIFSFYNLIC